MSSSLRHRPPSTTSSSTTSKLPKINRIQKALLTPEEQPLQRSTKIASANLLSQSDYLHIYKGSTIRFIGDNSIRILYRSLCKVLKFGRLLEYTKTTCQNGNYKQIEGESKIKEGGGIGMEDYQDIRLLHMTFCSSHM